MGNARAYAKITGGANMRGWFQSISAPADHKVSSAELETPSKVQEPYNGSNSQWWSANKARSTSKRSRSWPVHDSAITWTCTCESIAWKTLQRTQTLPWVGQRSRTTVAQTREENFKQLVQLRTYCRYRLKSSSGSRSSSASRTQDWSSPDLATDQTDMPASGNRSETDPEKPKNKIKRRTTIEIRMPVCKIFLSRWRSSQIIWRTQKSLCPYTFLRTQIRNVLRKRY